MHVYRLGTFEECKLELGDDERYSTQRYHQLESQNTRQRFSIVRVSKFLNMMTIREHYPLAVKVLIGRGRPCASCLLYVPLVISAESSTSVIKVLMRYHRSIKAAYKAEFLISVILIL